MGFCPRRCISYTSTETDSDAELNRPRDSDNMYETEKEGSYRTKRQRKRVQDDEVNNPYEQTQ